jgi:glycosyltransferase involved in cell wall biosynthesis
MRIAVYAIAKNESQFVERWQQSACDADSLHILDTGSTDQTVTAARDLGIDVVVRKFDPWRFDHARNASLAMVDSDADLCIALDMDEVLQPGWRDELEKIGSAVTRPRYKYTWSWESPGVPGLQYGGDKIHSRHGYRWKHPVHEVLKADGIEEVQGWCALEIHHHPDHTKSRGQYFPLLELAVSEDPEDDRNSHYLAREYFFHGQHDKAEAEFIRHLSLASALWPAERAQSCRYLYKISGQDGWLLAAIKEDPSRREARVDLALHYYNEGYWYGCLKAAKEALAIRERPLDYITEAFAWGALPHDLAAIGAYRLGYYREAKYHGMEALKLSPYEDRLVDNLRFYEEAAA